ncbi:isochorismatase family protein [Pseudonocardia sp. CA-107938]|uniref:isochorismatase family protein n=1 Tax=Pseudonocardia sp. CA-107938 TaxID=3240021 RepID=UPI003D8F273B
MPLTALDERVALVVVDLQNGVRFAPATPYPAEDVIERAAALAAAFREHHALVVLVKAGAPDGADAVPGRTDVPRWTGAGLPAGWDDLADELSGHPEDVIVTKRNWSAFYGTDLDLQLRRRGITQIVLAGLATSVAVDTTARAAHERGYHVTLATDAMTDVNHEAHVNSIVNIFPHLGETGTTAEILELLTKTRA